MSTIGPGSLAALNLAGSFSGAQRSGSETDSLKAGASDRSGKIAQQAMTDQANGDVAEADLSSERDPDGRQLFSDEPDERPFSEGSGGFFNPRKARGLPSDAFGERGNTLDVQA